MSSASPRRLLLVSYFYPPTRDTGAQRPAAMAKWLERLGWEVTVLTTRAFGARELGARSEERGAARDGSVAVIRAADLQTIRARLAGHEKVDSLFDSDSYSGKPHPLSKVIVPDPLAVAWLPFARRAALAAHRREPFDCVLTTSPPESAHAVGLALQRRGVRWVADVRDAWTFEPLRPEFPTRIQDRIDRRLERRWLGAPDAVVCVSEPAAADLRARGIADPSVIANAWDPDSDPSVEARDSVKGLLDPERFSILYAGRFGSYGRDPAPLAQALTLLNQNHGDLAATVELAIAGPLRPDERALFEAVVREGSKGAPPETGRRPAPFESSRTAAPAGVRITILGSLERELSLALQREADALLLLAQPTRSQLVNFKLFEYLAAGRPILALAAGTEAGRIAAAVGIDPVVRADDPIAIAAALAQAAKRELKGPEPSAAGRYAYPAAAEAMSAVLHPAG